jgi:UDP-N-acetylglucosamine diphosphorylase/glucosamine-1-phosphate N-acetyltransferase
VSDGPILVRRGSTISAFTRITGPCYIGENTIIAGDRITKCSIGEVSKIRGEISSSIVLGHSNKGHTGFVGHSYIGRWVNLGAGTTTSNLKNTYGVIGLLTSGGRRETRMQYLGSLVGDHAKTGIGTMLNTGTLIGAGANVFGTSMPSKYVPPFAWGNSTPHGVYAVDRFLAVAERVMARRHVDLSPGMRQQLERAHRRAVETRG